MYEEEIHFGKLLLKESETVLTHLSPVTVTFDPVTLNSKGFLCCPGWMRGQSLWKVGKLISTTPIYAIWNFLTQIALQTQ